MCTYKFVKFLKFIPLNFLRLFEPGVRVLVESESSRTQYIPQVNDFKLLKVFYTLLYI